MQKTVRMSSEKHESLEFYKYLCQKIGSEEVVKMRRLALCISDMCQNGDDRITSGSKGEGLCMKGSDFDIMGIDSTFKVYESETDVIFEGPTIPLIMNTEETGPCFTQLSLLGHHKAHKVGFENLWETNHLGCMLSSEQYKQLALSHCAPMGLTMEIHGPCLSDIEENFDLANCLKCDRWILQAQPWVIRARTTWPTHEIISKIISFGVLFVPIGCKGSVNENLEWRISFSVAEKFLIFSFSHTQLLCYALLKILLKEIIEKYADLKGLLCSYFLKTLMFWISEDTNPYFWRPDNIISCFKSCLQRLLYCVKYSILSHYFIPDNNLFDSRFNIRSRHKLETILENSYAQGIYCFASSETLYDYYIQSYNITKSVTSEHFIKILQNVPVFCGYGSLWKILHHCLHFSRTGLSKGLFALHLSKLCRCVADVSEYQNSSDNKYKYDDYKRYLSYLLIGVHSDAMTGWLKLASFLYGHKHYLASLSVIHYALQNYTDEKIFTGFATSADFPFVQNPIEYTCTQKYMLSLMKKETLYTVIKTLTIEAIFQTRSLLLPQELQLQVDAIDLYFYHPLPFAYFLGFLCHYHLNDITSCRHYLKELTLTTTNVNILRSFPVFSAHIMSGIAEKLMGRTYIAKLFFQYLVYKVPRLSWLLSVFNTEMSI